MLDIECFSFLNRAIESDMSPILIIATNRGITKIRGTNELSPHGIPIDLLDRLLIIHTNNYNSNEINNIITIRCEEEDVEITDKAKALLTKIGYETSLRYALNLIQPSWLLCQRRQSEYVTINDIKKVYGLFVDVKRSANFLDEYQNEFLFHKKMLNNNDNKNDDEKGNDNDIKDDDIGGGDIDIDINIDGMDDDINDDDDDDDDNIEDIFNIHQKKNSNNIDNENKKKKIVIVEDDRKMDINIGGDNKIKEEQVSTIVSKDEDIVNDGGNNNQNANANENGNGDGNGDNDETIIDID